eukprot:Skav235898  [mRNA]  locus=scaffold256:63995:66454:- [translate_table: standard]
MSSSSNKWSKYLSRRVSATLMRTVGSNVIIFDTTSMASSLADDRACFQLTGRAASHFARNPRAVPP